MPSRSKPAFSRARPGSPATGLVVHQRATEQVHRLNNGSFSSLS